VGGSRGLKGQNSEEWREEAVGGNWGMKWR